MKYRFSLVLCTLFAGLCPLPLGMSVTNGDEFKPTAQSEFVPEGTKLELLWAEGTFTEGPALAPDGSIIFSDIGDRLMRFDVKSGKTTVFRDPSGRANGLMFNREGHLLACEGATSGGNRRISITTGISGSKDGTVKTLADKYEGKRFNSPNDLAIDAHGRVYFTDPRYGGNEPREIDFEGIFLVTPEGNVTLATRDVQKPNGILVSPDGKLVYAADNNASGNRHLLSFVVQKDGTLAHKKMLYEFTGGRGIDGMTLDKAGNIYATAGTGDKAGIYVFSPEGKPLAFLATPGDPTNCEFGGGDESKTLYITAALAKPTDKGKFGLYRANLAKEGNHAGTGK